MNARKVDVIDTGLVEFVLPFDRGTEKIYFNPNDLDFFIRLTDMINNMSETYEKASSEYENATDSVEKLEITRRLNKKIKEDFDSAFGNNVSDVIFKYVSPNGIIKAKSQYYTFYILEWLMPKIEEETGKTSKATMSALEKAMSKHTINYQHKFNR
jgi:hypothetical protein